jgi:FMN reductase
MALRIVGLGGSLRASSRSRAALAVALDGAAEAGATVELLDLRRLELPMFNPEHEADAPAIVRTMIETCYEADGMLWSSPMYNGSVSGSFKNAIDWLHMLGSRDPAYLHDQVVGLISTAGGMQGLQVINTMDFSARSLRAWAVPYAVPISGASVAFGLRRSRRRADRVAVARSRCGGGARRRALRARSHPPSPGRV